VCLNLSAAVTGVRKMDSSPADQSGQAQSSRCHARNCAIEPYQQLECRRRGRFVLRRIPHCVAFFALLFGKAKRCEDGAH
jgi:hypothetical protein